MRTAFLIAPALGVPPGYYKPLQAALSQELGVDCELVPLPELKAGWKRLFNARSSGLEAFMDAIAVATRGLRSRGAERVILLGHSVGGQMGIAAAARWLELFDGLALVACGTPYWRAWPADRQRSIRGGIVMIDWVSRLLPWYPGRLLGFGGNQPRQLMRDWVGMALTGSYRHLGIGEQCEQAMRYLRLPVLAVNIDGDELAPVPATDFLLAKLPQVTARRATVGAAQLAGIKAGKRHTAWVRQPQCVIPVIGRWLDTVN
jgi:predicted alpha/beta hydrolase